MPSPEISRRGVIAGVGAAGVLAGLAACSSDESAESGVTATTPAATPAAAGQVIAKVSDVPVGTAFAFNSPIDGTPGYLMQPKSGTFVAYSAVCTHEGCVVNYVADSKMFLCPCHGANYDDQGNVTRGPARSPLQQFAVAISGDNVVLSA